MRKSITDPIDDVLQKWNESGKKEKDLVEAKKGAKKAAKKVVLNMGDNADVGIKLMTNEIRAFDKALNEDGSIEESEKSKLYFQKAFAGPLPDIVERIKDKTFTEDDAVKMNKWMKDKYSIDLGKSIYMQLDMISEKKDDKVVRSWAAGMTTAQGVISAKAVVDNMPEDHIKQLKEIKNVFVKELEKHL